MSNNVYLLTCNATGAQLLIDAADEPTRMLELVATAEAGWTRSSPRTGTRTTCGPSPRSWPRRARTVAGADDADELPVHVDERVAPGRPGTVGEITLDVIHLRGHTAGSVALAYADPAGDTHLFTGDCLFPGGSATRRTPARASTRSSRTSRRASSTSMTTTPGSIPATVTTRPSAPSAPTWRVARARLVTA